MIQFLDTNNTPLPPLQRIYSPAGSLTTVPVRFECRDGYFLWCTAPVGTTVEVLPDGESIWHDLLDSELDLASFVGMHDFELRVSNDAGTDDIVLTISETEP